MMRWTEELVTRFKELHAAGKTNQEIAAVFGVSCRAVESTARRFGIRKGRGNNGSWNAWRVEQLKRLVTEGLSCNEIAAALGGISRNAVIGKLHRLGIKTNKDILWDADRVARLNALLMEGKTRAQIGAELGGMSKGAITSKVLRLGLVRPPRRTPPKRRKPVPAAVARPLFDLPPEQVAGPRTLWDLEFHHCRWPVSGDGIATLFCAADKLAGFSYCAHHFCMAHDRSGNMSREAWEKSRHDRRRAA